MMSPREAGYKNGCLFVEAEPAAGRPLHGVDYEKRCEVANRASWDKYKASNDYMAYRGVAPVARLQHWWRGLQLWYWRLFTDPALEEFVEICGKYESARMAEIHRAAKTPPKWFDSKNSYEMVVALNNFGAPEKDLHLFRIGMCAALPKGTRSSILYLPPGAHGCDDPLRQRAEIIWHYPARAGHVWFTA